MEAKQLAFPFQVFEEELLNPLTSRHLTETEELIANLLLGATSEKPMKMAELISVCEDSLHKRLSERQIKIIIRNLRRDHAFPILTRRANPAGYWWCQSADEMKEFARLWQSQYFDEMMTLHIMMRRNYPRLAGQMRLPLAAER